MGGEGMAWVGEGSRGGLIKKDVTADTGTRRDGVAPGAPHASRIAYGFFFILHARP